MYLDSLDYDLDNPLPAQEHCFNEIKAAYEKLTDDSIILIDDCNLPGGGKGKLAIEWLVDQGWVLLIYKYQAILVKHI